MIPPPFSFYFLSACILLTFFSLVLLGVLNTRPAFTTVLKDKTLKYVFMAMTLGLLGWGAAVFPGFISMDDVVALDGIKDGQVTIWTSIIYGYLLSGFKMAGLMYGGPTLLTLAFYVIVIGRVLAEVSGTVLNLRSRIALLGVLAVLFLWPVQLALLSYHTRDSLYAVLLTNLFILLIYLTRRPLKKLEVIELAICTVIIGTIRPEGVFLALFVIVFLIRQKNQNQRMNVFVFAGVIAALIVNAAWSRQQLFWQPLERQYQLVQYPNSLSAILNSPEVDAGTPAMEVLKTYYDFQCIKNLKEGGWFSSPKGHCLLPDNGNPVGFSFYSALIKVFTENRSAYISHQWEKYKKIFSQSQLLQDMDSVPSGPAGKMTEPQWPVKTAIFNYLISFHRYKQDETGPTFLLLALVLTLVCMTLLTGAVRWLFIVFHLRIFILLAFAPDPQSKYFFTLCTLLPVSVVLVVKKYYLYKDATKPYKRESDVI